MRYSVRAIGAGIALIAILCLFTGFGLSTLFPGPGIPHKTVEIWARSNALKGYYFMTPLNTRKAGTFPKRSTLMILDEKGSILYYKQLALGSDFKLQPGKNTSYFGSGAFYVMNSSFAVIDSVKCIGDAKTDPHDFLILPNGNYLLIGKKAITEDFSRKQIFLRHGVRGSKRATAKYDVIQEISPAGRLVFEWDSRQIYNINDADTYYLTDTAVVDVTHFNSVDADTSGNLLVSVRFFDEVIKIRKSDGAVIWRMGGKRNQVKCVNDTIPFRGQHDARFSGPGRFTVFDNGFGYDSLRHSPRGLEYAVDDNTKTARLLWKHQCEFPLVCSSAGNMQRLENGSTLIGYGKQENEGTKLAVEIVDSYGHDQTQAWYTDSMFTYRTFFYNHLPFHLTQPKITKKKSATLWRLSTASKYRFYRWSNGQTTDVIIADKPGRYFVDVSNDGQSFFRSETQRL